MSIEINGTPKPIINDANSVDRKNDKPNSNSSAQVDTSSKNAAASVSVTITPSAASLNELESSVAKGADVNQQRVEAIKKAIASGEYKVNAESVAKKLTTLESLLP